MSEIDSEIEQLESEAPETSSETKPQNIEAEAKKDDSPDDAFTAECKFFLDSTQDQISGLIDSSGYSEEDIAQLHDVVERHFSDLGSTDRTFCAKSLKRPHLIEAIKDICEPGLAAKINEQLLDCGTEIETAAIKRNANQSKAA